MATKERDHRIDRLRILLCFMVITMHVVADRIYAAPPGGREYAVLLAFTSLSRTAVPCFFLISGAFARYDPKKAVRNALVYAAVLVIAAQLYRLNDILLNGEALASFDPVAAFFQYKYHLWYLFHFVVVSLVAPILLAAVEAKPQLEKYILCLLLLFSVVPGTVTPFAGDRLLLRVLRMFDPTLPGYLLYYLLGRMLYAMREELAKRKWPPLLGYLGSSGLIFALEFWKTAQNGFQGDVFFFNFNLLILIQALSVFCLGLRLPASRGRFLAPMAGAGLGIYIVHVFFIDWLSHFGFRADFLSPILGVPLKTLCVYGLSLGTVLLLRWVAGLFRRQSRDAPTPVG